MPRAADNISASDNARGRRREVITILHLSDTQFGERYLFGGNGRIPADDDEGALFRRLHDDLSRLADDHGLQPDLMIVTGDLTQQGETSEFKRAVEFLHAISAAANIPRQHVAIVPGNHDINSRACSAYFTEQERSGLEPTVPYWPKWQSYALAFAEFYADIKGFTFTPEAPWTLFEMPDLGVVVAGLNSTIANTHRDEDDYGWVGDDQMQWFAQRLKEYRSKGWLRVAAVHHNVICQAAMTTENLRDANKLDIALGRSRLANLLLHGHTQSGEMYWLPSGLATISTGSSALAPDNRSAAVPSQYQLVAVRRNGFRRYGRRYDLSQHRWIGDNRVSFTGSEWYEDSEDFFRGDLPDVHAALTRKS